MTENSSLSLPASYIRGGTSKGVFFALDELPSCNEIGRSEGRFALEGYRLA